ncbi:hypothetical protein BH20ACI4_BH20ACI4_32830 [soil metagenome]
MENTGKTNPLEIKIQGLLDRFLKVRSAENGTFITQEHLDQDTLAAFVEGNIKQREAKPIVTHLVDCSFCRNITTELVRLDLAFAGETEPVLVAEAQPTKIADVLSGILTRIFGSNEGAVFAHHEDEDSKDVENAETQEKE